MFYIILSLFLSLSLFVFFLLSYHFNISQCHFRGSEKMIFTNVISYLIDGNAWPQCLKITDKKLELSAFARN